MPRGQRPEKPYEGYPLFAHRNGRWAKKIAGVMRYFGMWEDHQSALARYLSEREDLLAGVTPRARVREQENVASVQYLCNHFLQTQENRSHRGEISTRTFGDYLRVGKLMVEFFGENKRASEVGPGDFRAFRKSFPKSWSLQSQSDVIQRVRTIFLYGVKNELISEVPKFGTDFQKSSASVLRKKKQAEVAKHGTLDLTAEQVRCLVDSAEGFLKPCILLGINAGFGNTDCSELTTKVVDLKSGWLDFPRPKTGVPRRVKLWPETIAAMQIYEAERPIPFDKQDSVRFFLTSQGRPTI